MKHSFVYSLFFVFILSCNHDQSDDRSVNKKDVYSLLNDLSKDSGVLRCINVLSLNPDTFYNVYDNREILLKLLFTDDDFAYMNNQHQFETVFEFDQNQLNRIKLISSTEVNELQNKGRKHFQDAIFKKYNSGICAVSLPLFNKQHNLAVVRINHYGGNNTGTGQVFVLKKENYQWKVLKVIDEWIS
jgi:hypothetical protein